MQHFSIPEATIRQAITNTQVSYKCQLSECLSKDMVVFETSVYLREEHFSIPEATIKKAITNTQIGYKCQPTECLSKNMVSFAASVYQDQTALNPFPNKPWFLHVCSTSLLKTLQEKEKLLVTSNFSISHSVFYLFR